MNAWNCGLIFDGEHLIFQIFLPSRRTNYCKVYEIPAIFEISNLAVFRGNMSAEVFENSESTNCTKAVFRGSPRSLCKFPKILFFFEKASFYFSLFVDKALTDVNIGVCFNISVRCGPPYNVSFSRHSGGLVLNVNWEKEDVDVIKYYSVRYKALGSLLWSKVSIKHLTPVDTKHLLVRLQ